MNKKYLKPEIEVLTLSCGNMMAASLSSLEVVGDGIDGEDGDAKYNDYDDWDEE